MGWDAAGYDRDAQGEIGPILARGERQLNGASGVAVRIVPGYSGAGVWSDASRAFIGMVVTEDVDKHENSVTYAIATSELLDYWPWLRTTRDESLLGQDPPDVRASLAELTARLADPREFERVKQSIYIYIGQLGSREAEQILRNALAAELSPLEREGVVRGLELLARRRQGRSRSGESFT